MPFTDGRPWWMSAVCYEVFPRSFADSTGSGEGDLEGLRRRLDHLQWLGVDAIWICPFYPSPMRDSGYDVADYCGVDPRFGTLDDFDRLLADAHRRGIRVLVDWVPNHTSDQHPWFQESARSRSALRRDWYYWRYSPNNWRSAIDGGSTWSLHGDSEQYYLHFFLPEQPDLNWYHDGVVAAMLDTLRFWLDRGVDGFRIDSTQCLGKDLTFADDDRCLAGEPINGFNDHPRTHEVLRQVRRLTDSYEGERVLVGEVNLRKETSIVEYYGQGDELNLSFNFPPLNAPWDPIVWRSVVRAIEERLRPADAWPVWTLSNHDNSRVRTRYGGSMQRARAAAVLMLTLRGTVFIYQGEELGLEDLDLHPSEMTDPGGRDVARGPIPWLRDPPHGWPGAPPWLPFPPDSRELSAEAQRDDPDSMLNLYRRLIRVRHSSDVLRYGSWHPLELTRGVLSFRRSLGDQQFIVLVNFRDETRDVELEGDWQVHVDSQAHQGKGELAPYDGKVRPEQALLLAPATQHGREQSDVAQEG
jgi:alpha-glucosidase